MQAVSSLTKLHLASLGVTEADHAATAPALRLLPLADLSVPFQHGV
jgi:hypothetical protein